jgi:hypothetical protein
MDLTFTTTVPHIYHATASDRRNRSLLRVGIVGDLMMTEKEKDESTTSRDAANIKLAIFLGLVALGVYAGFIWYYFK